MKFLSKLKTLKKEPFFMFHLLAFAFWYLAMFPGRLGYDYVLLTRMVQQGDSTTWWGANFFWIFKFSTFGGRSIFITSFLGLVLLTYALKTFISSLPLVQRARNRLLALVMATPLYSVFGTNVSHDVFQASGMLLLSSFLIKCSRRGWVWNRNHSLLIGLALFCLLTTQTGVVIAILFCIHLYIRRFRLESFVALFSVVSIVLMSNMGINSKNSLETLGKNALPSLLLIDLKCIAQHPGAGITEKEWRILERFASKQDWLNQTTCSDSGALGASLDLQDKDLTIDVELIKVYFSMVTRNPAIPFLSHVQRSSVALPPPFFQPPPNQIPWDISLPVGFGTNTALQSGPGLLHPSVDEPSVAYKPIFLKPLEVIGQAPTLVVNQASWFWGWGGFWLWPIYIFLIRILHIRGFRSLVETTWPTLTLHMMLFIVGPGSLGRYVMSTVLQGLIVSLAFLYAKRDQL